MIASIQSPAYAQQPSNILELKDGPAKAVLQAMISKGDNSLPQHSEAWTVLVTVALGMGLEKCGFPKPGDGSIFWKPATETMTPDQVMVLNRLVTSNFRNAETKKFVDLGKLFPITRQSVLLLSDGKARWNCESIGSVWQAATNYAVNKK